MLFDVLQQDDVGKYFKGGDTNCFELEASKIHEWRRIGDLELCHTIEYLAHAKIISEEECDEIASRIQGGCLAED